ncbi:hypothetical protein JKP88DRAFT_259052 [Tribonema minus]|uniref:Abnormal spindle-like microcephaly-associated protein ASH domain-containing protein n=1 Tax=Tribonema minus TaxID=303371 RepID=A0A836C8F2_9STRA|nr:hypothetical protein JKP88DRAFT_259052 [Tribonema minus]
MALRTGELGVISRADRVKVFGIECTGPVGDGIVFRGGEWSPGGEYIQKLTVKNVTTELKKLKYRLPTSRYFSMAYPELIVLSPGMEVVVDVVFRPVLEEVYDETIFFKVQDGPHSGGFHVPVRALLPTLQISAPPALDMGFVQIDTTTSRTFTLRNTGQVPAPFRWVVPPPFSLSPAQGVIPVGGTAKITCSIAPTDTAALVSNACVHVGEGANAIKPAPLLQLKLTCIAKFCHVAPSVARVEFGRVLVGAAGDAEVLREVVLRNDSVVPAEFKLTRLETDCAPVFDLSPSAGTILPEDEVTVAVRFTPLSAGTYTADHYRLITVGGNTLTLTVTGWACGPHVWITKAIDPAAAAAADQAAAAAAAAQTVPDSVNFRDVEVGGASTRVVTLSNAAAAPCRFSVAVPHRNSSVFKAQLTLCFSPPSPSNYYRRFFILLEGQLPLVLDCMGTGYIPARGEIREQRPAPLRHAHVQAFRNRAEAGLGRLSPEELDAMVDGGMAPPLAAAAAARPLSRSGDCARAQACVAREYFKGTDVFVAAHAHAHSAASQTDDDNTVAAAGREITASCAVMDFGYVSDGDADSRTVVLTNHTSGKVRVVFATAGGGQGGGFSVEPGEGDIAPGGSAAFAVRFAPRAENMYYLHEIEACVFFKNQRTFRLVRDATLTPPWCVTVTAVGHTFDGPQFIPQCTLSTSHVSRGQHRQRLEFPACHVGDSVYQTIRISNSGNIPAMFRFELPMDDAEAPPFQVKPSVGLLAAGELQLIALKFTPPVTGRFEAMLTCVLNNSDATTEEVLLIGRGAIPALSIGPPPANPAQPQQQQRQRDLYLKPTCVGLMSQRAVVLRNSSRVPVVYSAQLPGESAGVFSLVPACGSILGNDCAELTLGFAPRAVRDYRLRLPIEVRAIGGQPPDLTDARQLGATPPAPVVETLHVTVHATAGGAAIAFDPAELDFGVSLVKTPQEKVRPNPDPNLKPNPKPNPTLTLNMIVKDMQMSLKDVHTIAGTGFCTARNVKDGFDWCPLL